MPKYAIIMTADEKYLPGVNGQLNAYRYYGMEEDGVEFHLVHTFPDSLGYIQKARKMFPKFVATGLNDFMIESGRWTKPEKPGKAGMKYPRWWYPAERLADYDAICVLDADRQIVNNFTRHFEMIARSNMIGLAKNDWSDVEWFSYDDKRAMEANPPLYSNPYFITGKRAAKLFPLIPEYAEHPNRYYPPYKGRAEITGDMHPVNLTLLQTGMIKDLFPLEATQWVFVNTAHVRLVRRQVGNRHCIGTHGKGDLLYTYHRKFWGQRTCERFMNGHTPMERVFGVNNTRILWEFTKFFNTELYLRLPWIYGDFPSNALTRLSANWLDSCIRTGLKNVRAHVLHDDIIDEISPVLQSEGTDRICRLSDEAIDLLVSLGVPVVAALNKQW